MNDICERKHGGNAASVEAFQKHNGRHHNARIMVYNLLAESQAGMTSKEIAQSLGWPLHHVSGRCSELKAAGKIRGIGDRRMGAEVLVKIEPQTQINFEQVA